MINKKYLYKTANLIKESFLKRDNHNIYYQILGNPNGKPLFIIHGGPGGGNNNKSTRFFNPEKYMFVLIDQRGCGKSTPWLETNNNTIEDLAQDIEEIRKINNLDKINIFGGSWGTTLALYYAIKYPENISKMLLRGIFLARIFDINWFCYGARFLKPIEFSSFVENIDQEGDIVQQYYQIFNSNNQSKIEKAALRWYNWENSLVSINKTKSILKLDKNNKKNIIQLAFFENFYFKNHCFMEENFILKNIQKIAHLPITIIHGEYDIDCLPIGAYELHQKLQNSKLILVKKAAHSQWENNIALELIKQGNEL
ncbi:prolyl aminopeptidase [Mycoplasma phocimorsus]|uniref:prolyl aminopeptidase n=1 Tax=Mycoplasma phocimorsus TaxID=3045839 RepID=UPI0024C03386|nr:prolyl aminopeptidase [Mycoplasma phocimorsus]MDJ1648948.1 prolyl aminopeptidase [Mycoplasma phocimorsus]